VWQGNTTHTTNILQVSSVARQYYTYVVASSGSLITGLGANGSREALLAEFSARLSPAYSVTVYYTVHTVYYTVHSILYSTHSILYSTHSILYSTQYTIQYIIQYTQYIIQYTQ